jgi:hypothetical protein
MQINSEQLQDFLCLQRHLKQRALREQQNIERLRLYVDPTMSFASLIRGNCDGVLRL